MVHYGLRVAAKQAALWRLAAPLAGGLSRIPQRAAFHSTQQAGATPSTLLATTTRTGVRSDRSHRWVLGYVRGYSSVLGPRRETFRRFSGGGRRAEFPTLGEALANGLKGFLALTGGAILISSTWGVVNAATLRSQNEKFREDWEAEKLAMDREVEGVDGVPLMQLVSRAAHLAVLFLPVGLLAIPAMYLPFMRDFFYKVLRSTLERSGAAFIKWGQWAATRPDMFHQDMCVALSSLHSSVPNHSWAYTEEKLKEAYRVEDLSEVFDEVDHEPLGSGSIAQVHRARFKGEETSVAIKVRHPAVEAMLLKDFAILNSFAALVDSIPGAEWLGLQDSLVQFGHTLGAQVRLDFEATNLRRFVANFRAAPHVATAFPVPNAGQLPSPDILVETFEEGHSVAAYCAAAAGVSALKAQRALQAAVLLQMPPEGGSRLMRRASGVARDVAEAAEMVAQEFNLGSIVAKAKAIQPLSQKDATHVVRTGKETYLQMLLADNFIHADMHPGNILLRENAGGPPTLVLIDAGMVDAMSIEEQEIFIGVVKAMGAGDGRKAARYLMRFSKEQSPTLDREAFTVAMQGLFDVKCKGFGTGVDVGEVLRGVLNGLRVHRVRIDAQYATSVVNLLCVESVAAALDPSFNLLDESEYLLRFHTMLGRERLALLMSFLGPAISIQRNLSTRFYHETQRGDRVLRYTARTVEEQYLEAYFPMVDDTA
mmetsp:Transcript_24674/g.58714  ORF Transcript_24674/g.58714 Transcript_24674/m.58714 type:complete len:710 (-) Transcript_24674:29-2158(-)